MTPTPKRRWFQFSLRTLFVMVTVLCVWLAFVIVPARRQQRTVEKIRGLNAPSRALYDYVFSGRPKPRGPEWLRRWIGDDYFQHVAVVKLVLDGRDDVTPDELANLPGLEQLDIWGMPLPNDRLGSLARLHKLQRLSVDSNDLTDRGLDQLSSVATLEDLGVRSNQITDEGVKHIARLSNLRQLYIGSPAITDRGLAHLAALRRLVYLNLTYYDSTTRTSVPPRFTKEGVARLQAQLPELTVEYYVWKSEGGQTFLEKLTAAPKNPR